MPAQKIQQWRDKLPDSLRTFSQLNRSWRRPDPTYGILAAALLWPVRNAALANNPDRDMLQEVCGEYTDTLLKAMSDWPDDRLAAARDLAKRSKTDTGLKLALDHLLIYFKDDLKDAHLLRPIEGRAAAGINILGNVIGAVVNIGSEQYIYGDLIIRLHIFSSVRQVALVLTTILLVIGGAGLAIWISLQPPWMTGSFNIAIAAFQLPDLPNPTDRQLAEQAAAVIRQNIYTLVSSTYANTDVKVEQKNMGVVTGEGDAQWLVEKSNANMVIWGHIEYVDDRYTFTPSFYVANSFNKDLKEISGNHTWLSMTLTTEQLKELIIPTSPEHILLEQKTNILTHFTEALTYLSANQLSNAAYSIDEAISSAEHYTDVKSGSVWREVIYLFASTIYRLSGDLDMARKFADEALALDINHQYGRGYIALGNVYYEIGLRDFKAGNLRRAQSSFQSAFDQYQQAAGLGHQPPQAVICEKAQLGIGNVYMSFYQMAAPEQQPTLAQDAVDAFQMVINSYNNLVNTSDHLAGYLITTAAQAAYLMGLVQEWENHLDEAEDAYQLVLTMTAVPDMVSTAQAELKMVQTRAATTPLSTATTGS